MIPVLLEVMITTDGFAAVKKRFDIVSFPCENTKYNDV